MRNLRRTNITAIAVVICLSLPAQVLVAAEELTDSPVANARFLLYPPGKLRTQTLRWIRENDRKDMIGALLHAMRFLDPDGRKSFASTLRRLTGQRFGDDWDRWIEWQQMHPEIEPFEHFDVFLSATFARIDPNFQKFIYGDVKHEIRLEEIVWGGVVKDGIPALTDPVFTDAAGAGYLGDDESVFGIEINGDARAYPYRIMDWHEMFNDVVGSVSVSLAYCTLCGSGILFVTGDEERDFKFVFGSSGFLYRSNKLMYDEQTHSLWNQFTGRPVVGPLTGSGLQLEVRPVVTTSWSRWKALHPDTKVLSLNTGYDREYRKRGPYRRYFSSRDLMFPAVVSDTRLKPKDQVFVLRMSGAKKAWPLAAFRKEPLIHDRVGAIPIVLIGDAGTRTVRAYRSGNLRFELVPGAANQLRADNDTWLLEEDALHAEAGGRVLTRLPGHIAYWFAWSGYFSDTDLYGH